MTDSPSLASIFAARAASQPDVVAFRYRAASGEWSDVSWQDYLTQAELVSGGLRSLGMSRGDRIGIVSIPRPEWLYVDAGAQGVGALVAGLFVSSPAPDIRTILDDLDPFLVVAGGATEYRLLREAEGDDQAARHVVVADPAGIDLSQDSRIVTYAGLIERGSKWLSEQGRAATYRTDSASSDGIAVFYTSGTSGRPKGAVHSTDSLVGGWSPVTRAMGLGPGDRSVSSGALGSIGDRWPTVFSPILFGTVAHLPSAGADPDSVMCEVRPTFVIGTPQMWELAASRIRAENLADPSPAAYASSLRAHGLDAVRQVLMGGARTSADVVTQWRDWGVQLREMYAATETGVVALAGQGSDWLAPLEGVEVRCDDSGELQVRTPGLFLEYWRNPSATRASITADRWFRTGDIGRMETGDAPAMQILDRQSNIVELTDGTSVAPAEIEAALKESPYIEEAVLAGDGQQYLTVLIGMDLPAISRWAAEHSLPAETREILAANPAVLAFYLDLTAQVNKDLASRGVPAVANARLLPRTLQVGTEVTATGKVRRRSVVESFADLLGEMYAD
jgi:long-chain acyl-CoA synthetase